MGALQKIRNQSTLLVVTIAVGLICFIVPWHEVTNFINMKKDRVFEVNGEVIKVQEYQSQIQSEQFIQEAIYGSLNETQNAQLRENVYQSMLTSIIINEQAQKIGLSITEEEMKDLIQNVTPNSYLSNIPLFVDPQTGIFSREAFNTFLNYVNQPLANKMEARHQQMEMRNLWDYIQSRLKDNSLQMKYTSLLVRGLVPNNLEIQEYKNENASEATISYVKIDDSYVKSEDVSVSNEEIKALYNLRNKEIFQSQYPTRTVSYFVKEVIPSEEDLQATLEQANTVASELTEKNSTTEIAAIVNDYSTQKYVNAFVSLNDITNRDVRAFLETANIGDVKGPVEGYREYNVYKYVAKTVAPDSITIQLLPLVNMQAMNQQTIQFADSLMNIVKDGKNFTDLIKELYPNNPEVEQTQAVTEMMLAMSMDNASQYFEAPVGSVHQVTIQNTIALLNIVGKSKPVNKVKVAQVNLPVEASEETFIKMDNELNTFIANLSKNVSDFDKAALEKGYDLKQDIVLQPNYINFQNIPGTREIIKWAFDDNNSNKDIHKFDLAQARVVAVVNGEDKAGYLSVDNKEVNSSLKEMLIKQKKAAKIVELLEKNNSKDLANLAEQFNSKVDTTKFITFYTNEVDFPLNVWSKLGSLNTISKPIAGTNGVYVMNKISEQPNQITPNERNIKQNIIKDYGLINEMFLFQIFNSKSKIEDNRVKFNF